MATKGEAGKSGKTATSRRESVMARPERQFRLRVAAQRPRSRPSLPTILRQLKSLVDPYRPELHYMRGPGPKWHAKHRPAAAEAHPAPACSTRKRERLFSPVSRDCPHSTSSLRQAADPSPCSQAAVAARSRVNAHRTGSRPLRRDEPRLRSRARFRFRVCYSGRRHPAFPPPNPDSRAISQEAHRCAILDDYQNVALRLADWSEPRRRGRVHGLQPPRSAARPRSRGRCRASTWSC